MPSPFLVYALALAFALGVGVVFGLAFVTSFFFPLSKAFAFFFSSFSCCAFDCCALNFSAFNFSAFAFATAFALSAIFFAFSTSFLFATLASSLSRCAALRALTPNKVSLARFLYSYTNDKQYGQIKMNISSSRLDNRLLFFQPKAISMLQHGWRFFSQWYRHPH